MALTTPTQPILLKHDCRSDDEMFGQGGGAGEKAANGKKASAMEVDDSEDDEKENSAVIPAKVSMFPFAKVLPSLLPFILPLLTHATYDTAACSPREVKKGIKRCLRPATPSSAMVAREGPADSF